MKIEIGDTLPNGAIAVGLFEHLGDRIVLARIPDNPTTPYATWAVDPEGHTYWGHYSHSYSQGIVDFFERVKKADPAAETPDANQACLDSIVETMSGSEWTVDTLNGIADILRKYGYTISDLA